MNTNTKESAYCTLQFIEENQYQLPNILQHCDDQVIAHFLRYCRICHYKKHQQIIETHTPGTDVFYILSGSARVVQYSDNGKEISFADLRPGQGFGELSAIDGQPRSAGVLTESKEAVLLQINARDYKEIIITLPEVAFEVIKQLSQVIRILDNRLLGLATLTSTERVRLELMRIARENLDLDGMARLHALPSGELFASRVNCTREVVSRELSRLKKTGIIVKKSRYVEIHLPKLRDICR